MAHLNPYLSFPNNCQEAMEFYRDCLGGELHIQKVGDMPEMAAQMPQSMQDKVLHSMLKSGDIVIMASDLNRDQPVEGNTVQLCINCNSVTELDSIFEKLSSGGSAVEVPKEVPWGKFGAFTDKYGKNWMLNFQSV